MLIWDISERLVMWENHSQEQKHQWYAGQQELFWGFWFCRMILFHRSALTAFDPHKCLRRAKLYSPQELKGDTEVVSEVEVLLHVDDVVAVIPVPSSWLHPGFSAPRALGGETCIHMWSNSKSQATCTLNPRAKGPAVFTLKLLKQKFTLQSCLVDMTLNGQANESAACWQCLNNVLIGCQAVVHRSVF